MSGMTLPQTCRHSGHQGPGDGSACTGRKSKDCRAVSHKAVLNTRATRAIWWCFFIKDFVLQQRKKISAKGKGESVFSDHAWTVKYNRLGRNQGRPPFVDRLFQVMGEKIPVEALPKVKYDMKAQGHRLSGVYIAHDSMGCSRYIGRGDIFQRLEARIKTHKLEIKYFSFYVVCDKKHEREIETLLIRSAGFLLEFNTRKKRVGISSGDIKDYEAGRCFYERQYKKGRTASKQKVS